MDTITFIMREWEIADEYRKEVEEVFSGKFKDEHLDLHLAMFGQCSMPDGELDG